MIEQDTHPNALSTAGGHSSEFFSSVFENLPMLSGHSSLLQSLKGNMDPHLNLLPGYFNQPGADMSWQKAEKHDDKSREGLLLSSMLAPERKRTRNIGSKSKRLLVDCQDALELKLKWDEVQDLLRPPPTVKPSKFVIEDHEFEEYEVCDICGFNSYFYRGFYSWCSSRAKGFPQPCFIVQVPIHTALSLFFQFIYLELISNLSKYLCQGEHSC